VSKSNKPKEKQMKFMILVKADKNSEAGVLPNEKLLTDMGKYNEGLVKAGVMLAAEGLHPTSKGARVKFSGGKHTVTNGPFPRIQGPDRRFLDLAGEVERRSH
jgi:hypothetical protein